MRPDAARTRYVVVHHEGCWRVSRHGRMYGPYPTQEVAIRSAIDVAYASGLNDRPSQVLIREPDGTDRIAWTFGIDSHPLAS